MVRVISVHHFLSQNVQTVEQPTACAIAPPDRFLLALMSNCIEVRDLNKEAEVMFTFPTVDEVTQICHSKIGDYVATVETKFNHQNREINFVRVYVNWCSVATFQQSKMTSSGISLGSSECGMVQPMRARIAGRVTPTSSHSDLESLEMIEIPVKRNPHIVACCPITGNLLILSNNTFHIYIFRVKTHDVSKMKFIDFEDSGLKIEITFQPAKIEMRENYIAAMNKDSMLFFKVYLKPGKGTKPKKTAATHLAHTDSNGCINYERLLMNEIAYRSKEKIVTVNLPSITRENSLMHKHNPFTFVDKEMKATISLDSSSDNKMCQYKIKHLMQIRLIPISIENSEKNATEEFKCFVLKPLYSQSPINENRLEIDKENILRSASAELLCSMACALATQQEGYLFFFEEEDNPRDADHCITVYPFTAPVFQLVMEDYLLHALTETGLESYTLRLGHKFFDSNTSPKKIVTGQHFPNVNEGVCLVGLRPFLGVEQMLLADHHLLILANADISPTHSVVSNSSSNAVYWTLYSLALPTPINFYKDILSVANTHRFSSAETYCHLMIEAFMVLKISLMMMVCELSDDNLSLSFRVKKNFTELSRLFRKCCALLGDHFVMCTDKDKYNLAIWSYKTAQLKPIEIFSRVKAIQVKTNNEFMKGLVHYVKFSLLDPTGAEDDSVQPKQRQEFLDHLLKLLKNYAHDDLPRFILKNKVIQQCSTDVLIEMLTERQDFANMNERNLALCTLYLRKNNVSKALDHIIKIERDAFVNLMIDNWRLMFDFIVQPKDVKRVTNFSELAEVAISVYFDRVAILMASLIFHQKVLTTSDLINIFQEYLPSHIEREHKETTRLIIVTMERYFEEFLKIEKFDNPKGSVDKNVTEASRLLARSYLAQLKIWENVEKRAMPRHRTGEERNVNEAENYLDILQPKCESELDSSVVFSKFRWIYVRKMPPFQIEITSKLYAKCAKDYQEEELIPFNDDANYMLAKLQALLISPLRTKQISEEVRAYLALNPRLRGRDSLLSIMLSTREAAQFLVDKCPQCLPYFAKDRCKKPGDSQFLIATVQQKIMELSKDENLTIVSVYYKKILKDILILLAHNSTPEDFQKIFPEFGCETSNQKEASEEETEDSSDLITVISVKEKSELLSEEDLKLLNEISDFEPYVTICKDITHANQIRKLITTTGQQLLTTLKF